MFIHREDDPSGAYLIPQASHAWLAWQVAQHWGNRDFSRPAPRSEVLAAVLLHDAGWSDFDAAPGVDGSGRPRTFDRMPVVEHLNIWRACVRSADGLSRYAALLVASHFAFLASMKTADLLARGDTAGARCAQSFIAEMERLQGAWREALVVDPRYERYLDGPGWQTNAELLAACDRISVFLCAGLGSPFKVEAPTPSGEPAVVELNHTGDGVWRVHPWPLEGDKLRIHCQGRRLATTIFDSGEDLRRTLSSAPVSRLSFTFAKPSKVG
jgi:hypothetical protein